jgi:MSHA biogenesis protein MshL
MMKTKLQKSTIALAAFALVALTGCSSIMSKPVQEPDALQSKTALVDESELHIDAGFESEGIYVLRSLEVTSQELPAGKFIRNLSVTSATVGDALTLLASASGMQLVFSGAANIAGPTLQNVSGTLPEVLSTLAKAYGIFWSVEGQKLVVSLEAQYVLQLPPLLGVEGLSATVSTLKQLGARDVFLNNDDRTVVLRANGTTQKKITAYLDHVRANRSMIVYDIDVWQVSLSEDNSKGIDWSSLNWTYSSRSALTALNSAANKVPGFGMTFTNDKFNVNMLASWLQTQGNVKSLSRPRLAMMAGSKGTFNVGQSSTYVASVGTTVNGTTAQTTTQTATLATGLQLTVAGDLQDNTVMSRVNVSLSDLLGMKTFKSGDTELALPQTATRQLETIIRARAGDTVLLGGITSENNTQETSSSLLAASARNTANRSELVIAIRPRVIKFNGKIVDKKVNQEIITETSIQK